MSAHVWSTRADVLKDLRAVTGGKTEVNNLDGYVVVGERPPPTRRESIDEDEIQYHFGGLSSAVDSSTPPDLDGITQMLQLVQDIDDDDEPKTVFRNTMTDEISISKLNPNVTEFVPSSNQKFKPQPECKTPEKRKLAISSPRKLDHSGQPTNNKNNQSKLSNENTTNTKQVKDKEVTNTQPHLVKTAENNLTINGLPKRKIELETSGSSSTNSLSKTTNSRSDISLDKKIDVSKMKLPEIEEMKEKMKSTIIDSSKGDTIQHKKQKNVAIATLLRLCTAPPVPDLEADKPVKLFTPDYFEASPGNAKADMEVKKESPTKEITEPTEETLEKASTATSSNPEVNYVDPFVEESITKVNDWFNNAGSPKPKPKPLPVLPPAAPAPVKLKDSITFKKKNTSNLSVNSPKSETSSEKKKQCAVFVPSEYANNLLQKYEKNAKTKVAAKEDWRVALERQCYEKDEQYRKKKLEEKNASSPSSESAN